MPNVNKYMSFCVALLLYPAIYNHSFPEKIAHDFFISHLLSVELIWIQFFKLFGIEELIPIDLSFDFQ